jgi:tRNA A-37 threonylcarbamoyl transferase component Bud32/Tol biopolymer transport system component
MGEVFRARDTRLGRDVAIKSLPVEFAQDPERLARFEREARLLATLNHPNVAGIHGIEEAGGARYLVLEFVDGETLAARLTRGALPLDEAIAIATQIASGVEAAHESGVIHRDLKPGNVIITPGGQVKVLDFGLATSSGASASGSDLNLSHSPTLTNQATRAGVILGTAAYMSPEQARGKAVDRRTDIWSFGCVLYECLTGRQLYQGETVSDLIARILEREPDWSALPANTPSRLRELLKRCLRKDPKERLRDIGDARIELEEIARGGGETVASTASVRRQGSRTRVWVALTGVAMAAAALTAVFMHGRASAPSPAFEFTLEPPAGHTFVLPANPVVSPDGRSVACCVQDSAGLASLAVRPLDRDEIRIVPGTDGATYPFWSPDSRSIAVFAGGKLLRIRLDGSAPVALADAVDGRCGSWSTDGVIVFVPTSSGPIFKVPATGGSAVQITTLDRGRGEVGHRYPALLRDGRHFLYVSLARDGKRWLCVGDVNGGKSRALRVVENTAVPASPGWVATVAKQKVLVQRFNEGSLSLQGEPIEIAQCGAWNKLGDSNLGVDGRGTIVYQRELKRRGWLRWYDVGTHSLGPRLRELDTPQEAALAPDQRHVAVQMGGEHDLWLVDLAQPVPTRLTFFNIPQLGGLYSLVWSPDSKQIGYSMETATSTDVMHAYSIASSTDTTMFTPPGLFTTPCGWTSDGRLMAALCSDSTGNFDPWVVPVRDPGKATIYQATPDFEYGGSLSLDGRWFACQIAGPGKARIQILSFPHPGSRFQLTFDTDLPPYGVPFWSADGRSLVVVDAHSRVLAVPVTIEGGFRQGEPRVLFTLGPGQGLPRQTSDLRRFLVIESERLSNPSPLAVLTGWQERVASR